MRLMQGVKSGTVEAVMAALDREALAGELPVVIRAIIGKTMKQLGFSTAGLRVTLVVTDIAQRWGLVLTKPAKKPTASKPTQKAPNKRTKTSDEVPLSIRQEASLLAPLLEKLALQSLTKNAPPPLSLEEFQEQARLTLLEYGGSYRTQDALDALIRWLDDHDYLLVDQASVQVIAIPISTPISTPDPVPD